MFLAIPTNIRIGWKSLPGTNTVTYGDYSSYEENKVL
jgi:hypothetical protein